MATCPFCQGVVEAALTREGGPCPRCFNVIPGEDAVTDPGAAQRAREAAAQAARQRSQRRRSVLLAAAVLLSVAGGIGYAEHQRRQQYAVLEMSIEWDDYLVLTPDELAKLKAAADAAAAEEAAKEAAKEGVPPAEPRPKAPGREPEANLTGGLNERLGPDPAAPVAPPADPTAPRLPPVAPQVGLGAGPGPVVPIQERPVLTRQSDIDRMVKEQMKANRADIKRCYENALRLDETLSGRWTFQFVILPSGATDQIKITGERMKSESLETCFAREVRGWTFQRIDQPLSVSIAVPLGT